MKEVHGISFSLSSFEGGLWFDHDDKKYQPSGWGIRLALLVGSFARPVPKFWTDENPWQEEAWFTLRLPIIVLPFFSFAIGKFGFYIGGKRFTVDSNEPWAKPFEYGSEMVTISATIRKTRWK